MLEVLSATRKSVVRYRLFHLVTITVVSLAEAMPVLCYLRGDICWEYYLLSMGYITSMLGILSVGYEICYEYVKSTIR